MATDLCANGKHPRDFRAEERREGFLASKAKALAGDPIDADDSTEWHEVDHPLTVQQRELIPCPTGWTYRYSPLLWLKLIEPGTGSVIKCRGWFDHRSGCWFAGISEVEQGRDGAFLVSPIAWAHRQE
jgi:hypothetical protein